MPRSTIFVPFGSVWLIVIAPLLSQAASIGERMAADVVLSATVNHSIGDRDGRSLLPLRQSQQPQIPSVHRHARASNVGSMASKNKEYEDDDDSYWNDADESDTSDAILNASLREKDDATAATDSIEYENDWDSFGAASAEEATATDGKGEEDDTAEDEWDESESAPRPDDCQANVNAPSHMIDTPPIAADGRGLALARFKIRRAPIFDYTGDVLCYLSVPIPIHLELELTESSSGDDGSGEDEGRHGNDKDECATAVLGQADARPPSPSRSLAALLASENTISLDDYGSVALRSLKAALRRHGFGVSADDGLITASDEVRARNAAWRVTSTPSSSEGDDYGDYVSNVEYSR